jgi:hypothetical protein
MTIPQSELQGLFPKFAAPLVHGEAARKFGGPAARQLAQTFWRTMIDGPIGEARLWKSFGDSFTTDDVAMLRRCFEEEMKPSVSAEQLAAIGDWYTKGEDDQFAVGDQVRVQYGTVDPCYPDLPLGGWAGTIVEVDEYGLCHIKLNQATLDQIHPVYRKRCKRDDLEIELLDMDPEDLDPDLGEGLSLEQPTNIQTKPLDLHDQKDRIRAALGVTTDDAVPPVERATLRAYGEYLKARLAFPLSARFSEPDGVLPIESTLLVVGLSDSASVDHRFGLVCRVQGDRQVREMPLALLEVGEDQPHHQLLDDYRCWFERSCNLAPVRSMPTTPVRHDDEEADPATDEKTGRNAPCPCGSGKKFKKCCLKRQNAG